MQQFRPIENSPPSFPNRIESNSSLHHQSMSNEDQECVSFLMTLKYRSVTPPVSESHMRDSIVPKSTCDNDNIIVKNTECIPLATAADSNVLNDMECFVRSQCCEFFIVTEDDGSSQSHSLPRLPYSEHMRGGPRGIVTPGSVGIRCPFCRLSAPSARACHAASIPSKLSDIYDAVMMFQSHHLTQCQMIPMDVKNRLTSLQSQRDYNGSRPNVVSPSFSDRGGPRIQQYWIDSARSLGLTDSADGIRFAPSSPSASKCNPVDISTPQEVTSDNPVQSINSKSSQAVNYDYFDSVEQYNHYHADKTPLKNRTKLTASKTVTPDSYSTPPCKQEVSVERIKSLMGETTLVSIEDKDLVPDYLFLAMAQMKPTSLTEADRIGCYKGREIGFLGMSCKHCGGQPGFGKYFPATVRSLAQTTTSQTIVKHIAYKCRLCPEDVRSTLITLQDSQTLKDKIMKDSKSSAGFETRPRYGSRKVFFQRIWERIHDTNKNGLRIEDPASASLSPLQNSSDQEKSVQSEEESKSHRMSNFSLRESDSSPLETDAIESNASKYPSDNDRNENKKYVINCQSNQRDNRRNMLPTKKNFKRSAYEDEDNHHSFQSFTHKRGRLISS